jgi:hypothetical protein
MVVRINLGMRAILFHKSTYQIAIPVTYIKNVGLDERGSKVSCYMEDDKLIIAPAKANGRKKA